MLDIGLNVKPSPDFSIQNEYFTSGSEIIGGIVRIILSGTHHASSVEDYNQKTESILSLNGSCRTINSSTDCGSLSNIVGSVGFVEKVTINPGNEILNFEYSIEIVVSRDNVREPIINRSLALDYGSIPTNIILNKYSIEESYSMDNLQKFSILRSGELIPVAGKVTINAEIGLYPSDRCDSSGDEQIQQHIGGWLQSRSYSGDIKIPNNFKIIQTSQQIKVSENGGSITKEYVIVHNQCEAIVSFNTKEQTKQIMGDTSITLSGSVEGINSFAQAQTVYDRLKNLDLTATERLLNNTCGQITKLPVDLCRMLVSSKRTDNSAKKSINFDFTYKEVEKCLIHGYRIITEYSETKPVKKAAEYIIPGKSNPILFISGGTTAERAKLKVSAKYTSCSDFTSTVKTAVEAEFNRQKNDLGINGGNYLVLSLSENEGRYSYSKTEEYIKCE